MFDQSMKVIAFFANAILLVFFLFLSLKFTSEGINHLNNAGGFSQLMEIVSSLKNPLLAINQVFRSVSDGSFFGAFFSFAGAWVVLIAAAGSWWMTALGIRWLFFAVKRSVSN